MLPVDGTAIIRTPITLYFLLSGAMANGMTHCDRRRLDRPDEQPVAPHPEFPRTRENPSG